MASKTDSTKVMWRVQVRKSRNHVWKNGGLYETRDVARRTAVSLREEGWLIRCGEGYGALGGYGFGNTRVIRHVRGGGR